MTNRESGNSPSGATVEDAVVEISGLSHSFGEKQVLSDIDLQVHAGEVFGFLGHNGAGKTTTVNILTTLIQPTSGSARVCGFNVVDERLQVQRRIGYLPENVRLYDNLTADENLRFFARLSGVTDPSEAIDEALGFLDCRDLGPLRVGTFSKGMRQRIGIAQAILHKPALLFLDEPTSGLDPMGVRQLRDTIARLNYYLGMTVFMNTHLLSEVSRVCTTIGVLDHGALIYRDSMEATLERFPDESSLEDIYVRLEET